MNQELKEWGDDKAIVLSKVRQNGYNLSYVSTKLKDDKEVALSAFTNYGLALEYASDRLKDVEEVVLAVVKENGYALRYASDQLKDDKDVVLAAVSNYRKSLRFSSDRLKSDVKFAIQCAKMDSDAIAYFKGEAASLFSQCNNNVQAVEVCLKQQQANAALLSKIKEISSHPSPQLFKRKLLNC